MNDAYSTNERNFSHHLHTLGLPSLRRDVTTTVQINLGKRCNQACRHCHVNAGPNRTEMMSSETVDRIFQMLERSSTVTTVDITGGAPELHPEFKRIVSTARKRSLHVMDRCNLTVLTEPGQQDTASFLAKNEVEIFASLPCYGSDNVDKQRGNGVFKASITGIKQLNEKGYGMPGTGLALNLVYNPLGAFLPPSQADLRAAYKDKLLADFGVHFTDLYTITNMPIARFENHLRATGQLEPYLQLLTDSFNPQAVPNVMCRSLISISWTGELYDCDFNQMLALPIMNPKQTVWSLETFDELFQNSIKTASHCFGCTAGSGSSCGGSLT